MDAFARLKTDVRGGLRQLEGMRLTGEIPVREGVINDVLAHHAGSRGVMVHIEEANHLIVRKGLWHATATLDQTVNTEGTPRISVRLASALIAWTLARIVRLPYLTIDGRFVTIDLGRVPALRAWEPALRQVRRATLTTTRGVLHARFEWWVAPGEPRE